MKLSIYLLAVLCSSQTYAAIDRKRIVQAFNVVRNASSDTPLQVGNGNFAFNVDITGLQSFKEFNTLSSWGFHNASLPTTPGQTNISGTNWLNFIIIDEKYF